MRTNTAKAKLRAGKPVSVVNPTYTSAGLVELLGRQGFDVIFLDTEHGPAGWDQVEDMVRAAELVNATPIVRAQSHDVSVITRALDRGAGGVQIPHVNSRTEAEEVVRHAKFAPIGHRGFAGGRSAFGEKMSEYTERANAETMVVAMLSSCTWPRVGSCQISGAKTLPTAAAVAAVPARNEINAIQPVNQPKCGPARRLDHW